jgi:hypothetical protein
MRWLLRGSDSCILSMDELPKAVWRDASATGKFFQTLWPSIPPATISKAVPGFLTFF